MQVHTPPNSLYPVAIVKGEIPPQFFNILDGISHNKQIWDDETYYCFPFWHLELLSRYFGEPDNEQGKLILDSLRTQQSHIDAIRNETHPLLDSAPSYLYKHQRKAWALAVTCRTFAFFLEPGLGKTAIMIELMRMPSRKTPTLVIMPATLIQGTWIPEIEKWAPELIVADLQADPDLALKPADVYLLNKEKLARNPMFYYQMLRYRLGRVIVDESSMMKNPESKTTEGIGYFKTVKERYLLSGTPAPNGAHEYWSQIHFIRPGLLPTTYNEYANEYFNKKGGKYEIKLGSLELVMDRISSCSISMTKDECLDLPKKNYIEKWIELPNTKEVPCRKAYIQLREKLKEEIRKKREEGKGPGSMFAQIMKLREITSGFIVTDYNERVLNRQTGLIDLVKRTKWNFVSDHKYKMLAELLEEIGSKQVVIWMNFKEDFKQLDRLFPSLRGRIGYIYGDIKSQDDRSNTIKAFQAGKLQYIAANPASLGHGVTLIDPKNPCSDVIYFDLDYSLEKFEQSQDRVHRIGQTFSVNYYAILVKDTIDEAIWSRLKDKKELLDEGMNLLR